MNLNVLHSDPPWYADGLKFTCTQCGNCCSGPRGYVWITHEEIIRLAEHLQSTPEEVVELAIAAKSAGQFSLPRSAGRRRPIRLHLFTRGAPPHQWPLPPTPSLHSRRAPACIYAARPLQVPHLAVLARNVEQQAKLGFRRRPLPRHEPRAALLPRRNQRTGTRFEDWPQHHPDLMKLPRTGIEQSQILPRNQAIPQNRQLAKSGLQSMRS